MLRWHITRTMEKPSWWADVPIIIVLCIVMSLSWHNNYENTVIKYLALNHISHFWKELYRLLIHSQIGFKLLNLAWKPLNSEELSIYLLDLWKPIELKLKQISQSTTKIWSIKFHQIIDMEEELSQSLYLIFGINH